MTDKELREKLQLISLRELTVTRHSASQPNYQHEQVLRVKASLEEVRKKRTDLLEQLKSGISVIPEQKLARPQIENIGLSAEFCLDYIQETTALWCENEHLLKNIIITFLEQASTQSRVTSSRFDSDRTAMRERETITILSQTFNRFMHDAESDFAMRQELFMRQVKNTQSKMDAVILAADSAQAAAKEAHEELNKIEKFSEQVKVDAEKAKGSAQDASKIIKDAVSLATAAQENAADAEKTVEGMVPNMLTVLGIFVGVIVAVVACYLTIVLERDGAEAIAAKSIPLAFMFAWMMGHVLVTSIFLLLYLTSKLTDRSLACHCKGFDAAHTVDKDKMPECNQCIYVKQCNSLVRLRARFPYVYWINVIFVIGYLILTVIHLVDLYFADWLYSLIHPGWWLFVVLMVISFGIITSAVIASTKFSKKKTS